MNKIIFFFLFTSFTISVFSQSAQKKAFADTVFAYICSKGILFPEIVMKQAILETGYFYPNNLMAKNNLFGFRVRGKNLYFNSWQESVDYYKNWQLRKYTKPDENYYKFLVRIKYATSHYPSKLKKISWDKSCPNFAAIPIDTSIVIPPPIEPIVPPLQNNSTITNEPKIYIVKKGDSLSTIAKRNKITVQALKTKNKLKSNLIHPGQKLTL